MKPAVLFMDRFSLVSAFLFAMIFGGTAIYSQSTIPGMNDKSSETIKKIMDKKREKLTQMETDKSDIKEEKKNWSEVKTKMNALQNLSKKMYNFEAPFDEKVTQSSNEYAFRATANRNAEIGEYSVEILNKAQTHRIASEPLPREYKISAGEIHFIIGKDDIKFTFNGGTVDEFVEAVKRNAKDRLKASITYDTKKTQILIVETEKSGKENQIAFGNDKTREIFKKMNFYENVISFDKTFLIKKENLSDNTRNGKTPRFKSEEVLAVRTSESFLFTIPEQIPWKSRLTLSIDLALETIDPAKIDEMKNPTGPNFGKYGDITLFDIYLEGESSIVNIPPWKKQETKQKEVIEDDHYLELVTNKRKISLDPLKPAATLSSVSFDLSKILQNDEVLTGIILFNKNTYKILYAAKVRFYDEDSQGGIRFKNELSKAEDALIILDGIRISRSTNFIDDLIKGVTLNIFETTTKKETLKVDRNYELIVSRITEFIKNYNDLIDHINKNTKVDPDNRDEKKAFSGEYGLVTLVNKLRTIMMNSYPTQYGKELALMSQIGISTNANGDGKMDSDKIFRGGVLEINEELFIKMMENYPEGIKQLFGFDTNQDQLVDTGIGFETETILKAYTAKNTGFIDSKQSELDRQIRDKDKQIASYKKDLEEEEIKLKKQFYEMDKATKQLDEETKKIDNFNKQGR